MYNLFSILSTLIHFSPIRAFSPLWSYTVHFVHLGSIQSILSTSVQSSPHWSNSVHFIYLGRRQSDLVRFSLFCLLRFYSVHIVLIRSIWSHSVQWSTLFHLIQFCPSGSLSLFCSTLIYFCTLT